MTVGELIKELQRFDASTEVFCDVPPEFAHPKFFDVAYPPGLVDKGIFGGKDFVCIEIERAGDLTMDASQCLVALNEEDEEANCDVCGGSGCCPYCEGEGHVEEKPKEKSKKR